MSKLAEERAAARERAKASHERSMARLLEHAKDCKRDADLAGHKHRCRADRAKNVSLAARGGYHRVTVGKEMEALFKRIVLNSDALHVFVQLADNAIESNMPNEASSYATQAESTARDMGYMTNKLCEMAFADVRKGLCLPEEVKS